MSLVTADDLAILPSNVHQRSAVPKLAVHSLGVAGDLRYAARGLTSQLAPVARGDERNAPASIPPILFQDTGEGTSAREKSFDLLLDAWLGLLQEMPGQVALCVYASNLDGR